MQFLTSLKRFTRSILHNKAIYIGIFLICLMILYVERTEKMSPPSEPGLCLSITENNDIPSKIFTEENLNNNYDGVLSYHNISDVTIYSENKKYKLEEAIYNGKITVEEIIILAQLDAKNGYCTECSNSYQGLTTFIYRYPTVELSYIHDVYELPNGREQLIRSLSIFPAGHKNDNWTAYTEKIGKYEYRIDREDWGVEFEVISANATSLAISCSQANGQQIGNLKTEIFFLYDSNTMAPVAKTGSAGFSTTYTQNNIEPNRTSQFTIDWSDIYGVLSAGNYVMSLHIIDEYDNSIVHPLMRNYYDKQNYYIEFTIP